MILYLLTSSDKTWAGVCLAVREEPKKLFHASEIKML